MKPYTPEEIQTVLANLKNRRMDAYYCESKEEAVQTVLSLVPRGASVGWGGSVTLGQIGLTDALADHGCELLDRAAAKTPEEQKELYARTLGCDWFFMSTNAMTEDGLLVNIDGRGNRVAFLCYGPENVCLIVGINKLVPSLEEALTRASDVAAPQNAVRLHRATPCAKTGKCMDCRSPDCICAQTVVTRLSHIPHRIKVILVGETLGY